MHTESASSSNAGLVNEPLSETAASNGAGSSSTSSSKKSTYEKTVLHTSPEWKKAICVFCGSSDGNDPEFAKAAEQIGQALSRHNSPLVYGGGTNGLMGAVAQATYKASGRVLGVIPRTLMNYERPMTSTIAREIQRPTLATEASSEKVGSERSLFIPVETMHERKQVMASFAELGFIALPGGYGTFEEILEMVTWTQLRIHTKPVVLLNINNFYSSLRTFIQNAIASGFIKKDNESFIVYVDKPEGKGGDGWDWGEEAVRAVKEWHKQPKGEAYNLKW